MKTLSLEELVENCYLLPWSEKNNPNGWIEPTTFCQLKCPGCYRGLDKDNPQRLHEDFFLLKKQIDDFIETRNIQTVSIAGGEPLLYPKIFELVQYASLQGLKVMIFTNGIVLNEAMIQKLKNAGATRIVIHIDEYQMRPDCMTEEDVVRAKEKYCDMFRRAKGISLGFIQPLDRVHLKKIFPYMEFYRKNIDVVSLVVFTLYREICWDHAHRPNIDTDISVRDIVGEMQESFEFRPCAYLGSTRNINDPTWLFSMYYGDTKNIFGFLDQKIYKFIQKRYYKNRGKYLFTASRNTLGILTLLRYAGFRCMRETAFNFFKKNIKNFSVLPRELYLQTLLILRGPEKKGEGWDLCQGCPDAMYYRERLVPSCILEEIKKADGVLPSAPSAEL